VFDDSLRTRIFRLDSGVTVYSPIGEVGQSVRVTREGATAPVGDRADGNVSGERLRVEGTVVEDKLSRRRG
jgi:hypothetical protein